MPVVRTITTAAKVTTATYRIVATAVMGFYLIRGVADYERDRRKAKEQDGQDRIRRPVSPTRKRTRGKC